MRPERRKRPTGQASPLVTDAFAACADAVSEWRREASFGPVTDAPREAPRRSLLHRARRLAVVLRRSDEYRFVLLRLVSVAVAIAASALLLELVLIGRL